MLPGRFSVKLPRCWCLGSPPLKLSGCHAVIFHNERHQIVLKFLNCDVAFQVFDSSTGNNNPIASQFAGQLAAA